MINRYWLDTGGFHYENDSFDFYLKFYFLIVFVQFGDMSLAQMIPLMELSLFLENVMLSRMRAHTLSIECCSRAPFLPLWTFIWIAYCVQRKYLWVLWEVFEHADSLHATSTFIIYLSALIFNFFCFCLHACDNQPM